MKELLISPLAGAVTANVTVPGSKSYTNRALLVAAMTPGSVKITNALVSDDTKAMIDCLKALGIEIATEDTTVEVIGDISIVAADTYDLDADLSGVTMRFMLALSTIIPGQQTIRGQDGLEKRPIGDAVDSLMQLGADITYLGQKGYPPLRVNSSKLSGTTVRIAANQSSQYVSALLLVAPYLDGLTVQLDGELVSRPYVAMTIEVMKRFGVTVGDDAYRKFAVDSGQRYEGSSYDVEADVSSACYFFAVAALTKSTVTVDNLNPKSLQADMGFLKILEQMGSNVTYGKHGISVKGSGVRPLQLNMLHCPDQAQTLAVLAAFADGATTISDIRSLRVKETERIAALETELQKMGIATSSTDDTLTIRGGKPQPAVIETYGDHRMAMSFAVAGAKLDGVRISNPGVVSKTFPDFWEKLASCGVATSSTGQNIVIIGMRGSGKTTVAKKLAKKLGMKHFDLDAMMVAELGKTTPQIVAESGWDFFRDRESDIATRVSDARQSIISTGGGIVLRPQNVTALKKNGIVVLLSASVSALLSRLGDGGGRPALTDKKTLRAEVKQVLQERQHLYENAADITINTDGLNAGQVADRIIDKLGARKP